MVERSLSMREVRGSIPRTSNKHFCCKIISLLKENLPFLTFLIRPWFHEMKEFGEKKVSACNVRESNPGRPRGRRAFYH